MIISGGSRQNWGFFAWHLTNTKDNTRVKVLEIRGMMTDTVYDALRDMNAVGRGTGCKNSFYHADINPRENEPLTDVQREQAVDTLERNLGFTGQPRIVVQHEKNGRTHWPVIWSRINTDTMTVISDSHDFIKHQRTARELERALGHEPVRGVHVEREGPRPARRAKRWEYFRARDGQGINPDTVTAEVTPRWRGSDTGQAFTAALDAHGYRLCQGDRRDFCILDPTGHEHNLTRRIDGARVAEVRAKIADVDRDALPTVAEPRAQQPERQRRDRHAAIEKALRPAFQAIHEGRAGMPAATYMQQARAAELGDQARDVLRDESSGGSWAERMQLEREKGRELEPEW